MNREKDLEENAPDLEKDRAWWCLHCGHVFWGRDGIPSGILGEKIIDACPAEGCDGAGQGFDIWPADSEAAIGNAEIFGFLDPRKLLAELRKGGIVRLIQPSYEILECPTDVLEKIERAARTCYKSEDRIGPGTAEKLTRHLLTRGHNAMIEFGGWICVRFVSNRGFTHEMVRHRLGSFAQESTRYCNYSKGKFGGEITCVEPLLVDVPHADDLVSTTRKAWEQAEAHYLFLLEHGAPPQIAREVLPIGLKAEIVVGANTREWLHIFGQRCSLKAHPRMRELMVPLREELRERIPVLFDE